MPGPTAGGPKPLPGRRKGARDDPELFGIRRPPPGPAALPDTLGRAHTRCKGLRTWQRTRCPAARSRKEAPFAAAPPLPRVRDQPAQTGPAAWEDTRIAPAYPPGTVWPGRPPAFAVRPP